MNVLSLQHPGETRSYAQSLALSALAHGLAIAVAVMLLSDLRLAPEPEPFKWDVAVIEPPAPQQVEQLPAPKPAPSAPAQAEPEPVKPQPVVQTVQRTVQQVVRQEIVREVRQVVQAVSQPAQTLSRTGQTIQAETSAATPTEAVAAAVVETSPTATQPSGTVTRQVVSGAAPVSTSPPAVVSKPASEAGQASAAAIEQAGTKEIPVRSAPATKADYGWLAEALWRRVEQLKHYPHLARMNRWEGKVVLRAVIGEDGQLLNLAVAESSGHSVLDHDALDVMRRVSPLKLKHPLGKPQVVVQVPISYKLH